MADILDVLTGKLHWPLWANAYDELTPFVKKSFDKILNIVEAEIYEEGYNDAAEELEHEKEEYYCQGVADTIEKLYKRFIKQLQSDATKEDIIETFNKELQNED